MKMLALALAASGALALGAISPAAASFESSQAKEVAGDAAAAARQDLIDAFGKKALGDQLAFLYKGDTLVAVSTISSGKSEKPTPEGIFPILDKKKFHRSVKYDNAPMPFMQRLDKYGTALHGGHLPGYPASHGCIRLPGQFAAKLFSVTEVGTPVLIGA